MAAKKKAPARRRRAPKKKMTRRKKAATSIIALAASVPFLRYAARVTRADTAAEKALEGDVEGMNAAMMDGVQNVRDNVGNVIRNGGTMYLYSQAIPSVAKKILPPALKKLTMTLPFIGKVKL